MNSKIARVALDVPIADGFDYLVPRELAGRVWPGSFVVVPWGKARRVGIVFDLRDDSPIPDDRLKSIATALDSAPAADGHWLRFVAFAGRYYHRAVGEVALPAIPKGLRTPPGPRSRGDAFERARKRAAGDARREASAAAGEPGSAAERLVAAADLAAAAPSPPVDLTDAQERTLEGLGDRDGFRVTLVHGVTGSGKTEVYLRWIEQLLARSRDAQALLLVPEIALTPQLLAQVRARFPAESTAVLHSELPDGERAMQWLAAADGRARIVVGTRLAVLAPMPRLAAIVVDEEHDASYKQQEGVRYSARDLAIARASECAIPVVLGSATPSLETWLAARRGRYRLLGMPERVGGSRLPRLRVVDPRGRATLQGLAPETVSVIEDALGRGGQALVFLNRRGYAPVLTCDACGWVSRCANCSAYRVLHRNASGPRGALRLVCHHCGGEAAAPRACPDCGNVDLTPTGRGTQRVEEALRYRFPEARIARLDRDVARRRGAARDILDAAHAGDVDLLVGTQMLAKGHDFRRLSLVVVVDADSGLYSSDFRAPERLFALLTQVSGRAGRGGDASEVLVQTRFPAHPMFAALARHDWDGYANALLAERRENGLPPFVWQALLRAEARSVDVALSFLSSARALATPPGASPAVRLFDPVPMPMVRLAGRERAQLLVESASRRELHAFLDDWLPRLSPAAAGVRWQLDVDPLEI